MCCDPVDNDLPEVGECVVCGGPIDCDGGSTEVCNYSPCECLVCGWSPCDGSC